MQYWENGFYLEQNKENTRKEITDEKYKELIDGQCNGKQIISDINGNPILVDYQKTSLDEITDIKDWFNNEYTYKEQKLRRLIALNKITDEELLKLYNEAEIKRARIQELEKEV